jgi:hydrogenase expression/formation protein HypE
VVEDRGLPPGKLPAALLRELLAAGPPPPEELRLPPAIGEDACVIRVPAGALVAATDPITLTGHGIGAHAVVINANDVAVLGVRPRWFLACVLLPPGTGEAEVRALFAEMRGALADLGAMLVGGHTEVTSAVTQPVVVGQMLGLREDGRFVRTGGVRATDAVLQVGPAPIEGAAVLAREAGARLRGVPEALRRRAGDALRDPGISVVAAALRAADLGATALHDPTEGGLSAGLHELAEASGVALRVDTGSVLWFEPGLALCEAIGADPWGVLASGTLLAAFPASSTETARATLAGEGYAVRAIGVAEPGAGVCGADGSPLPRHERDELSRVLVEAAPGSRAPGTAARPTVR